MPGKSGGDGAGGGCGEENGVWSDTNAAEVQAVGVEADAKGRVGLGWGTVMDLAGGDKEVHACVLEAKVPGISEFNGQLRAARAMERVCVFVFPTGVMEQREEPDDLLVGGMMAAEVEAVAENRAPVSGTMIGVDAEAEPGGDELPERKFGRAEHGVGVWYAIANVRESWLRYHLEIVLLGANEEK